MEVTPAVFVPQMLFSGFYIKMEQIPSFLRWIQVRHLTWRLSCLQRIALVCPCVHVLCEIQNSRAVVPTRYEYGT